MEFNVMKETNVEYCENMYALSMNYLKKHDNVELKKMLDSLVEIEDSIRVCNDINSLTMNINKLNKIIDRIEGIIHE